MKQVFETRIGKITGEVRERDVFFRGIPYAKTLRFISPKMVSDLGEFDATVGEVDCYQFAAFEDDSKNFYYQEFRREESKFHYAESPMTLNIVTPSMEGRHPVLLFIHGGGFECGTVGELPYGDTSEYAKRGIVFVSIGYRLNVFGNYRGGNYGLLDQLCALDWVRAFISDFGGDAENITLIAQSAGAMSLMHLLCSGRLDGKIKQAIMMSGAGAVPGLFGSKRINAVQGFWDKVDVVVGNPTDATPEELWRTWFAAKRADSLFGKIRDVQPTIDGELVMESTAKAIKRGHITDVPMMIGITSQDMMPMFIYKMALRFGLSIARMGHQPVYGYLFDRALPGGKYQAFHGSDLWYMFGNLERSTRPFEDVDYCLSRDMMDNVACFCKTGSPADKNWLPISSKQKGFRHFDGISEGLAMPAYIHSKMRETLFKNPGPA